MDGQGRGGGCLCGSGLPVADDDGDEDGEADGGDDEETARRRRETSATGARPKFRARRRIVGSLFGPEMTQPRQTPR